MRSSAAVALADYRIRVADMYSQARSGERHKPAWEQWTRLRDQLFRSHPQSPIPNEHQDDFQGLSYFSHDPGYRIEAAFEPDTGLPESISHSGKGATEFVPIGRVSLQALGLSSGLTVYWLTSYGGGIFLPFRDGTSGSETYGGGRYLIDSVKGAYLGGSPSTLILDFNYAYHPSCVYDDAWSCPLPPAPNHLAEQIPAGERLYGRGWAGQPAANRMTAAAPKPSPIS